MLLPDVDPTLLAGFQSALDQSPMVPDQAALAVGAEAKRQEFRHCYAIQLRIDEADVTARFGIEPVETIGKAGSRFLVQTAGIHRGMPPVAQDRVLLQCTFAITPFTQWRSARVWDGFRDRQGRPTHTPKGWARYLTDTVAPEPRR